MAVAVGKQMKSPNQAKKKGRSSFINNIVLQLSLFPREPLALALAAASEQTNCAITN